MKILVINGPNLNMLGVREPDVYGEKTYKDLIKYIKACAKEQKTRVKCFQTNYEGKIIEKIQKAYGKYDGIIINAGAYTHTSIGILDALKAVNIPTVEVHLTDINNRENFRKTSFISLFALKSFINLGFDGYKFAISYLKSIKKVTKI